MGKTRGNLAYVEASADNTNWTEVLGITKITPKHNGNPTDITTFCHDVVPEYKAKGLTMPDWGINLDVFWDETDPGQALILANKRTGAALYIKFWYDGTYYMTGPMVCSDGAPTPDLAAWLTGTLTLDSGGNMVWGP